MSGGVPAGERHDLTYREQMLDAQAQCLPCKLCGGKAVISDAGTGAGYYIECSNSTDWNRWKGCLIDQRRVSGWAYNVMEWWNRLMATPTPPIEGRDADVERIAKALRKFVYAARVGDGSKPVNRSARVNCPANIYHEARAALQALGERG